MIYATKTTQNSSWGTQTKCLGKWADNLWVLGWNEVLSIYMYGYLGDAVSKNKFHGAAMRTTYPE